MTFSDITANPRIQANKQLSEFLGIAEGAELDFFIEIERVNMWSGWQAKEKYVNHGHYVILCDGVIELFNDGHIEVRQYNFDVEIFKLVKMFELAGITLNEKDK